MQRKRHTPNRSSASSARAIGWRAGEANLEAQVVVESWRIEHNTYRPHGALGGLTPAEARAAWNTEHQPALS